MGMGGVGALGGQAPMQSNQAPAAGTDQWAQSLYRNPDQPYQGMATPPYEQGIYRNSYIAAQPNYPTTVMPPAPPNYGNGGWIRNPNQYQTY
jgi:hypothetical protein